MSAYLGFLAYLLFLIFAGPDSAAAQARKPPLCAGCHRDVWQSYMRTGMGRSFARAAPANTQVTPNAFYHSPSESFFAMVERGGEYFQRRHQVDAAGREVNVMEKRVDYVMGSGNHARTFLHRTAANKLI
ncbi:MAG: hypothetical protein R2762_29200 [Bryobacteraceae bacterium]